VSTVTDIVIVVITDIVIVVAGANRSLARTILIFFILFLEKSIY